MALKQDLINKLKDLGLDERQIRALDRMLTADGAEIGTSRASGGEISEESIQKSQQDLEIKKQKLKIEQDIMKATGDTSASLKVASEIGHQELQILKDKLDLLLDSKDATSDQIKEAKNQIVQQIKFNKSLEKTKALFDSIESAAQNVGKSFGFAQGGFGAFVDDVEISAKGFKEMGKSSLGLLKNVAKSFTPMKLFSGFVSAAVESFKALDATQEQLFQSTGMENLGPQLGEIANSSQSLSMRSQELANAVGAMQVQFQGFYNLNKETQNDVLNTVATMEQFGVAANDTAKSIGFLTTSMGMSLPAAEETSRELVALAQKLKLPPEQVVAGFNEASGELAKFGPRMVGEFKRLQGASQLLNMDVGALLQSMSKFDTFEASASAAGNLNAILGGPYLDTIELLNATESERIVLLKEGLEANGESFDQLDRFQKKAIADKMGLSVTQLGKMMSKSSDEIRAAMADADAQAKTAQEMQDQRVRMMSVMTRLGLELEKAMVAAFGEDLFSEEGFKEIKGIFTTIFKTVKSIAEVMGYVSGAISKVTGSPLMGVLGLGGAVAAGTIAFKGMMSVIQARFMPGGTPMNPSYVMPVGGGLGGGVGGGFGGGDMMGGGGEGGGRRRGRGRGGRGGRGGATGRVRRTSFGRGRGGLRAGGRLGRLGMLAGQGAMIAGPSMMSGGGATAATPPPVPTPSATPSAPPAPPSTTATGTTAARTAGAEAAAAQSRPGFFSRMGDKLSKAGKSAKASIPTFSGAAEKLANSKIGQGAAGLFKRGKGAFSGLMGRGRGFITNVKNMDMIGKAKGAFQGVSSRITGSAAVKQVLDVMNKSKAMNLMSKVVKLPIIGSILEAVFAHGDIKAMLASGMRGKELNAAIGSRVIGGIGGVLTGAYAATLVSALTAVGIPGFLAAPLLYMAGDYLGRTVFGFIADSFPSLSAPVGGLVRKLPMYDNDEELDKKAAAPVPSTPPAAERMNDFQFFSSSGRRIAANASDVAEGVSVKEGGVLAKKLDKLIEVMSVQGQGEVIIQVDRKEIARAAINGINKDFYSLSTV